MTRNTKIALGCGGAGCLILILGVIVVIILIFVGAIAAPGIYSPNRNSNDNYNSNRNSNSNTNLNENSSDSSDSSSLSDDDKHKLFQAAGVTKDSELILRVLRKIGFPNGTGEGYQDFVKDHLRWAMNNTAWVQSMTDPAKARDYVDEHIDD